MDTRGRVLVVDDSVATTAIVAKLFQQCGFSSVDTAPSGEHALGKLGERFYALVIADVNMTGMNGVQLLATVRGDEAYRQLCFLLMTAMRDNELIKAAMRHEADGILLKPFNVVTLRQKLAVIPKLQ